MVETSYFQDDNHYSLPERLLQSDKSEIKFLKLLIVAIGGWFGLAYITTIIYPDPVETQNTLSSYLGYAMRNGGAFLAVCGLIQIIVTLQASGKTPFLTYIKNRKALILPTTLRTVTSIIIGLTCFAVYIMAYSTIKTRIPVINPYHWDNSFMALDRLIFMGHDPWTSFAWLYDYPLIVRTMDVIYDVWAAILVGVWTLCFVNRKHSPATRYRFPIALMLTWFLGGTLMAILFSSVGPCYFELQTGHIGPYAEQMMRLNELHNDTPLRAIEYQSILWNVYEKGSLGLGGISAMPSMHCGTSALLVLLAWKRPALRIFAMIFFAFIFVASFMLAWHYAIDGLFVIPVVLLSWWISGKITRKITA